MRKLLGNSCAKGCLAYFIALLGVLAVAAFGVGGIATHLGNGGATTQGSSTGVSPSSFGVLPGAAGSPTSGAQAGTAGNPNGVQGGGYFPPTVPPAAPAAPAATVPVASTTGTSSASGSDDSGSNSSPQVFTPVQSQGGVISGQATEPFYVVQSGDTLWSISQKFGVDTSALSSVNNLTGDTIYAGQVLFLPQNSAGPQSYIPQPGTGSAQSTVQPQSQSGSDPSSDAAPGMPDTGINRKK